MALALLNGVGAGVTSRTLDVRSVGARMVPFIIYGTGNNSPMIVNKAPTPTGPYVNLGTIPPGGGQVLADEPIDYVQVITDAAETGVVSAFVTTSR